MTKVEEVRKVFGEERIAGDDEDFRFDFYYTKSYGGLD